MEALWGMGTGDRDILYKLAALLKKNNS